MKIILFLIIIIFLYIIFSAYYTSHKSGYNYYKNLSGYQYTTITKSAKKYLGNKPEELYMRAEIAKYQEENDEEADYLFNMAIFNLENINTAAPIGAGTIIDRAQNYNITVPMPQPATIQPIIHSDPQNVHDTNVNYDIVQKYNLIKDGTSAQVPASKFSPRAQEVITHIYTQPAELSSVSDTDLNILEKVYARAKKYNYIDSLNTSLENCNIDHIICTTGRVANILDSMTLRDPEAGTPYISNDIIRKEIYDETAKFLKTHKLYNKDGELSKQDRQQVIADLDIHLRQEFKSSPAIDKIIIEAELGIE